MAHLARSAHSRSDGSLHSLAGQRHSASMHARFYYHADPNERAVKIVESSWEAVGRRAGSARCLLADGCRVNIANESDHGEMRAPDGTRIYDGHLCPRTFLPHGMGTTYASDARLGKDGHGPHQRQLERQCHVLRALCGMRLRMMSGWVRELNNGAIEADVRIMLVQSDTLHTCWDEHGVLPTIKRFAPDD